MKKRKKPNWPFRLCLIGVALVVCGYTFVIPAVRLALQEPPSSQIHAELQLNAFKDQLLRHGMSAAIGMWIFFLGASIGSFLNVVVYRMPLGRSLSANGSYCPHCRVSIKSYDNIPILGWIKLRGRCRACRLPISPRYPLVEFLVAVLFFVLSLVELAGPHSMLPGSLTPERFDVTTLLKASRWDLFAVFLMHCLLISLLVSIAYIRFDGNRTPARLSAFGLISSFAFAVSGWLWLPLLVRGSPEADFGLESLYLLPAISVGDALPPAIGALLTFLVGVAGGAVIGGGVGWLHEKLGWCERNADGVLIRSTRPFFLHTAVVASLIGSFLGWQSVLSAIGWGMVVHLIVALVANQSQVAKSVPWTGWVLLGTVLHLSTWRLTTTLLVWPGANAAPLFLILELSILTILVVAASRVQDRKFRLAASASAIGSQPVLSDRLPASTFADPKEQQVESSQGDDDSFGSQQSLLGGDSNSDQGATRRDPMTSNDDGDELS